MYKSIIALATIAVAAFAAPQQHGVSPALRLKEERIALEYTVTSDEAVVVVDAESEVPLEAVEIWGPNGVLTFDLRAGGGKGLALSGFVVETREAPVASLASTYPEGVYTMRANTPEGLPAVGYAELSHQLQRPPVLLQPFDGAQGISTTPLVVWVPDPEVSEYRVNLEQGETDGLSVRLPAGSGAFQVPYGVLRPGTETQVEVGAVGRNGNVTLVESYFTTW